jgi:hypothetical protein
MPRQCEVLKMNAMDKEVEMPEQDGKPRAAESLTAPISGGDGAHPEGQPDRGTPPKRTTFAGVYTTNIRVFLGKLQMLPNADGGSGVSAKPGDNSGSSSKKQEAACSGQSNS